VADEEQAQPTEEELLEQLRVEYEKLQVSDVLVQTVFSVSSLGWRSLGEEHRDLSQAHLAIEALRALVPVLKGSVSEQVTNDFDQLVANMQLAYANAVAAGS
jgi:hypothetical protein